VTKDDGLRYSELLMPCVESLMARAGLAPRDIGLATCMQGPGSFTGVRIGFAAVKGLAAALGIPFTAVPTLDCMALPFADRAGLTLPVIDARKGRWFTALYTRGSRVSGCLDIAPEELAALIARAPGADSLPLTLTGPDAPALAARLRPFFPPDRLTMDSEKCGWAAELLALARRAWEQPRPFLPSPEPLYLRRSDAEAALIPSPGTFRQAGESWNRG
jgi:tRNA threonylcarbamoyladenosine biosynthesis protein TsaB